jgi:hypothetical protein
MMEKHDRQGASYSRGYCCHPMFTTEDCHRHTDKFYVDEEKLTPARAAHENETQTPDTGDE